MFFFIEGFPYGWMVRLCCYYRIVRLFVGLLGGVFQSILLHFMLPDGGVVMGPSVVVIVGVHEQSSFGNGPTIVVPTILTFTLLSN